MEALDILRFGSISFSILLGLLSWSQIQAKIETKTAGPAQVTAGQDSANAKAFDEVFSKIRSEVDLHVTFEQLVYKSLRKTTEKKTGRAYFQKPAKFRWAIDKPVPSEWVYTGTDLVSFDPKTKQGISYSAEGEKSRSLREIVDLILNPEELKRAYQIVSVNKSKAQAVLVLSPKAKNEIEKIELIFDLDQSFVREFKTVFWLKESNNVSFSASERES